MPIPASGTYSESNGRYANGNAQYSISISKITVKDDSLSAIIEHDRTVINMANALQLYITSIDLSSSNAIVYHDNTGSVRLSPGDIVSIQGMVTAYLNQDWTVVGVNSDSAFTFAKSENSISSTGVKTEAGIATAKFVLTISQITISGNAGGPDDTVATVTTTDTTRLVKDSKITISGLTDVGATQLNRVWTVISADNAASTFTFSPSEGYLLTVPDDGTYNTGTIRGTVVIHEVQPRLLPGAKVTFDGFDSHALANIDDKTFTIVNSPTSTSFEINPTEFGRIQLPIGEHSVSGGTVKTRVSDTNSNGNAVIDSSIYMSGADMKFVPRRTFKVMNNHDSQDIFSINTLTSDMESISFSARDHVFGAASSRNIFDGEITRIKQSDSVFRKSVVTINDEKGIVITDDKSTITPMTYHRVTNDGGLHEMLSEHGSNA